MLAISIFIFASTILAINALVSHYPGNQYIPRQSVGCGVLVLLLAAGTLLQFGWHSKFAAPCKRLVSVYFLLFLIAYLTTAVQYTPFPPIDNSLLLFDKLIHFDSLRILDKLYYWPRAAQNLIVSYALLDYEILFTVLCLILWKQNDKQEEFFFLILFTALVGFAFYYFFPTTAPASILTNPHFLNEQYATGIKFYQLHHHQQPQTRQGGLISMPSFHCLWALICQYFFRSIRLLRLPLLLMNLMIIIACVALGWHYLVDIIASCVLFYVSINVLQQLRTPNQPHQPHNVQIKISPT